MSTSTATKTKSTFGRTAVAASTLSLLVGGAALNALPAQAATSQEILNVAAAEVGTSEGSARANSYGAAVGRTDSTSSYSWCATFVSWVSQQSNATSFRSAAVGDWVRAARAGSNGLSVDTSPHAGDIVAYDWDGNGDFAYPQRHIGFVESVSGSALTTIEGNTSGSGADGVYRKSRSTAAGYNTLFIKVATNAASTPPPAVINANPGADSVGWTAFRNNALEYHLDNGPLAGGRSFATPSNAVLNTGDWDGDGKTSVGWSAFRNNALEYHLDNGPLAGGRTFTGAPSNSYVITGDWDGDGKTSLGWAAYRNNALEYHLDNGPLAGGRSFTDAPSNSVILTGDWDGDGKTSIGWSSFRNNALEYHVDNGPLAGGRTFTGAPADSKLITGDWDNDGKTSAGWSVFRNNALEYHVDSGPLAGGRVFTGIPAGSSVIVGDWDND
jgi:hypothetical protein